MELDTFITATIKAIIKGIKDSQDFAKENESRVNPKTQSATVHNSGDFVIFKGENEKRSISNVDFDIAVTVSKQEENNVSAGIKVFSIGIGGKIKDIGNNEVVSRLRFSIPIVLPNMDC